jgi:hypothetical protein
MEMAKKPTDTIALQVRMPEGLRAQLANEAEKAQRSLNSEILWRLGQTLSQEWQGFIAKQEAAEAREQALYERLKQNPKFQETVQRIIKEMIEKPESWKKGR